MAKVILISQFPLPYSKTGSWTMMYYNYLSNDHGIDYIVCHKPDFLFDTVKYQLVREDILTKVKRKFFKSPYDGYFNALKKILNPDEKYVIQIIDNFGIVKPLIEFLDKSGNRNQVHLQFFYHGFTPFYENFRGRWFFESIDEMVLLTNDSYLAHKNYYSVLPTRFSILHNGIDTSRFFPLSQKDKMNLKEIKGVANKKVFVWCSQDRPKKGLFLLLDVWQQVYATRQDIVLWVIGCEPKTPQEGVVYLGRIPNQELPQYFQVSDCYLFPTLWHEGFGLSLIEALHCGCYCIASSLGGVPEVLQYGKLGKLIERPHFQEEWEIAILEFLNQKEIKDIVIPDNLYSSQSWNLGMNKIIENAKNRLE